MAREPSMEQTALGLMTTKGIETDLMFQPEERELLRELAEEVAALAARPEEKEKAAMWTRLNDLKPVRPLVFCDPENGWNEIITQKDLQCRDKLARVWEMDLRKEIFWGSKMQDDRVIEPYFNVPYYYEDTEWGVAQNVVGEEGQEHGGSVRYDAAITDYDEDFKRLSFPKITVDYERTNRMFDLASEIFNGILTVRLRGVWWWSLGMTMEYVHLRGIQNLMLDMYDNPDGVHKMMKFFSDGFLHKLDFLEENNLLSLNTEGTYVGSAEYLFPHGRTGQKWRNI